MQRMYFLQSNPCLLAGRLQSERQVILKICGFKCIRWEFDFPSLEMTGSKSAIEECTRILKVMVSESVTIAESALMMHDLAFANPGHSTTDGNLAYVHPPRGFSKKRWLGIVHVPYNQFTQHAQCFRWGKRT